jgi:hypothetical protein
MSFPAGHLESALLGTLSILIFADSSYCSDRVAAHATNTLPQGGHQHWEQIQQLFRDRSYDALVIYLAAHVGHPELVQGEAHAPASDP